MKSRILAAKSPKLTKAAPLEKFAHQNTKPDLDLIQPRTMFWCVVEDNVVLRITQEFRPGGH